MDSEKAGKGITVVEDEEVIAVGAFDFGDGEGEGVAQVEIVDVLVEIFFGAVGLFDFESVESFGVDDAFDFAFGIDDWEVGKTRFVKFVEDEGA